MEARCYSAVIIILLFILNGAEKQCDYASTPSSHSKALLTNRAITEHHDVSGQYIYLYELYLFYQDICVCCTYPGIRFDVFTKSHRRGGQTSSSLLLFEQHIDYLLI